MKNILLRMIIKLIDNYQDKDLSLADDSTLRKIRDTAIFAVDKKPFKIEDFLPIVLAEQNGYYYGFVAVDLATCNLCSKFTLKQVSPYPKYYKINYEKQLELANWDKPIEHLGKHICNSCYEKGAVSFTCEICKQVRKSDELHETIGDGGFVCKICYETLTAKDYEEKLDAVYRNHEYDYRD